MWSDTLWYDTEHQVRCSIYFDTIVCLPRSLLKSTPHHSSWLTNHSNNHTSSHLTIHTQNLKKKRKKLLSIHIPQITLANNTGSKNREQDNKQNHLLSLSLSSLLFFFSLLLLLLLSSSIQNEKWNANLYFFFLFLSFIILFWKNDRAHFPWNPPPPHSPPIKHMTIDKMITDNWLTVVRSRLENKNTFESSTS